MAECKVTYLNGGGDTTIRDANFEDDNDAINFAEYYNAVNDKAKVIKITKVVCDLSNKDKDLFLGSQNYTTTDTLEEKFQYDARIDGVIGSLSVSIPYLPINMSDTKKKALVGYMREFVNLDTGTIQKSKRFN